ncbi:uncharacterized protein Z519_08357 [Cladophialophora bantiana CBS 173.52]|uniref:VOC domain-containing protein n=1 Tax=Cladophialophora bantiana (strain ATCC 10958 / CBS 173.52 / CDC B-1940 / NIH 8579) TaxID=1442370 RepID=A0A0D2EN98_CLAB1|nr:uncharacterized protein Z519_08357 [Cladophialophora bantiana CBS 173.52]KIW91461.1 hypothetical protein Z519_08357 [Cladophialophora bantiana CBS 173.52]
MDKTNILDTRDPMDKDRVGVHTVFAVRDITESLDLVKENGGHTHLDKTGMGPKMGFVARFVDPEGNLMGLYAMS